MQKPVGTYCAGGWRYLSRFWRVAAASLALAGTAFTLAAPADLGRGLAWLQAQTDNLAVASSVASIQQTRCEVATTLVKLSGQSPQVSALLVAMQTQGSVEPSESVACGEQLRQQLGQSILGGELDARRDGNGYAAYEAFGTANALDTGWALGARLASLDASDKATLLTWLQGNQASSGSFSAASVPDLVATAAVLRALKDEASRNATAAAIATRAATWLLERRDPQQQWLGDTGTTALVYEAVHPYTATQPDLAGSLEAFLLARQQPDGSWQGDAYVTALALRALALTAQTPVDPTLASAATVRGVVSYVQDGQPAAGVVVRAQPVAGPAKTAITDALGRYLLQGLSPGAIALTTALDGYAPVAAEASIPAGAVAIFSPGLYPAGSAVPTTARLTGKVQAHGTAQPLVGVLVQAIGVNGAEVLTDAQGAYDLTVPAGMHTLTHSLSGYTSQSLQAVLPGGATADAGVISLKPLRSSSTLQGVVTDLEGRPLAGAVVAVAGGPSVTTGAAGTYLLADLSGLQFSVQASATGYSTRSFTLTVNVPGDLVQDLRLPSLNAAYLELGSLTLSGSTLSLRQNLTGTAVVTNPSAAEGTAVGGAVVLDAAGNRIASLAALDVQGQPLSALALPPGGQQQMHFRWNSGSFPAGEYRFVARLRAVGSGSKDDPDGIVLATQTKPFVIGQQPAFFGSVTANPPVLRAGTNTPVKLSALIRNDGNVSLPAQDFRLSVVDTKTGLATHTQAISADPMPVGQLTELAFSDWTPAGGGNFRVELAAPAIPGSIATTTLYVGDSGTATFAVNRNVVPPGDQKVRGSVTVSGQSVADGTINDPLVPLVKQAIVRAVNYADNYAATHYLNDLRCFACHVQTQAVVGGERNLKYAPPLQPLQRTTLLNGITQYVRENGSILHDGNSYPNTNSTLGLWAVTKWRDRPAVSMSERRLADFIMAVQRADGSWNPDHVASWWQTRAPYAALNLGSLSAAKAMAAETAPKFTRLTEISIAALPMTDMKLAADAAGVLYLAGNNQVWSVSPSGTATLLVSNLPATSARPMPDGRLVIGADTGVYIRETSGALSRISTIPAWDVKPQSDGFLLSARNQNTVYTLTLGGVATPLFSNSILAGTLAGVQAQPDGTFVAGSYSGSRVVRFNAQGQLLDVPVPLTVGRVLNVERHGDGNVVNTEGGLFFFNKDWVAERWAFDRVFSFVDMPDGRRLINRGGRLYRLDLDAVDVTAFTTRIDSSVNKATSWLMAGSGIDSNNNIDVAFRLMGLGSAKQHFKGTVRENEFDTIMQSLGATLRARQRSDGGWVWRQGVHSVSDSMVTAMVGLALDTLNPSKDSPEVRKAIQLLLNRQRPDGTWITENSVSSQSVRLIPSTWVEIWLPTMLERLGGIDSDLSVTFPPTAVMSNPDRPPTSSVTAADGSTSHLWKLVGVTEASQQVNFDVTLKGMQLDETRPVAQEAKLVFKNSFVEGSVTAAIEVPKVAVSGNLTHTVATDKPLYTESDQAIFTAPVANGGSYARDAQVRFTVVDAAGEVVQVLPLGSLVSVAAGGSAEVQALWPAAGVLAGNYQVRAELLSPAGLVYGTASASFAVLASQAQAALARIGADRMAYTQAQAVQITSRVGNATANTPLQTVAASTDVRNAAGEVILTRSEPIDQLAPASSSQWAYSLPAGQPAGAYTASVQLLDAGGAILAQSSTSYTVQGIEQTGIGLIGQLQASPGAAYLGQSVQLSLQATNTAAGALAQISVTVRLIEPQTGAVIASYSASVADWQPGQTHRWAYDWSAVGEPGQVLVAAASARIGERDIPLAQANLTLLAIPYRGSIDAQPQEVEAGEVASLPWSISNPAPVAGTLRAAVSVQTQAGAPLASWPLELTVPAEGTIAGNQRYTTGEPLQTLTAILSQERGGQSQVLATTRFTIIDPPVPVQLTTASQAAARILVLVSCPPGLGQAEEAACVTQRSAAIEGYLRALGLTARAVATGEQFHAELRCGTYNTYWISGGAIKLSEPTIGELRAAIRRGDALWMDGIHDSRNRLLHDVAGVKHLGKLAQAPQPAHLQAGLYAAQTLPTLGQPTRFELAGGTGEGWFTDTSGQQGPVPAVVSHPWGRGTSLLWAFDLAGMVTAEAQAADPQLASFVTTSASHAARTGAPLTVGDITQVSANLTNQGGRTVAFQVEATLLAGLAGQATRPAAQLSPNPDGTLKATWSVTLAAGASQSFSWQVQAMQPGEHEVAFQVFSLSNPGSSRPAKLRASTSATLQVRDDSELVQRASQPVQALQPLHSADKNAAAQASQAVQAAQALHAQRSYEAALGQWLQAAQALATIGSAEPAALAAAQLAVALAMEASSDALCLQRCGAVSCGQ